MGFSFLVVRWKGKKKRKEKALLSFVDLTFFIQLPTNDWVCRLGHVLWLYLRVGDWKHYCMFGTFVGRIACVREYETKNSFSFFHSSVFESYYGCAKLLKKPVLKHARGNPKLNAILRALRENAW